MIAVKISMNESDLITILSKKEKLTEDKAKK